MERFFTLFLFGGIFLQSCMLGVAIKPSNVTDQLSLLAFKSGISIDPNNILVHNWSSETNFCNWVGVTCSTRRQRVTALKLPGMGLQGTISPHIGNLSFLVYLQLGNNSFHGYLPHELGHLRHLKELKLYLNQLEGVIPPSLSQCRALQIISLAYNNFSGGIPKELGILPELNVLYLGSNQLGGAIPSSLGNISTLRLLAIESNGLAGSIPFTIFNITSLVAFSFVENTLSGPFPADICHNSRKLENIFLSKNQLSGHIPSTIYKCRELKQLRISYNRFDGSMPAEIGSLPMLQVLYVDNNNISGSIPPSIGNCSRLTNFLATENHFHGKIPENLGHLTNLVEFGLGRNQLTGAIPPAIFNISSLELLSFAFNAISGKLPSTTGLGLHNLNELLLQSNKLGGELPSHLSNSTKLTRLILYDNIFTGPVPVSLGNLQQLRELHLGLNQLTGEHGSSELSFLTALATWKSLEFLSISYNPMNGFMPSSIGNDSSRLQFFDADGSQIHGHIPKGIGSFKDLILLVLTNNSLTGNIPSTIGGLESLQRLYLGGNKIEGLIPEELCHLQKLGELSLADNILSGPIPSCIGNLSLLQKLFLNSNRLTSMPISLWTLDSLIVLNLSSNSLGSHLPFNVKLDIIENIDLSLNQISGNIPGTFSAFQRLSSLNLSKNSLQGPIPQTFSSLVALEFMDLSYNNLSGVIPKSLEALKYLRQLNLSFNKLSGEIPSGGPFANFTAQSFLENQALCGKPILKVHPCSHMASRSNIKQILLKYVLPTIAALATLVAFFYLWRTYCLNNAQLPNPVALLPEMKQEMISYHEIVRATDDFSEANLLGVGSIGSAYKGILSDGRVVAVKVLNLQVESAFKSFDVECKVLRTVRHRNLVKVISSCSNPEFRALVLQYMSSGSLEKWLYSHNYFLNLLQRVSIMVDAALALEYLHHDQQEPIVHCDLKPNNVLLDDDLIAHVGDFGIAKILEKNRTTTQTQTFGTLGYIAPQYGSEGRVSTKCDIYSYGIMLLEVLTRKKPTDEMFSADMNIRQWVQKAFPDNIMEVIDGNLLMIEDGIASTTRDQLLTIFEVGLDCTNELPEERSDIKNVAIKMKKIKSQLLHMTRA